MKNLVRCMFITAALGAAPPLLAQPAGTAARPADATANKPSESGAQVTTPPGAVTGAGQPQGGAQPAQAQSAGSAKAKSGSGATAKKPVKKKKTRKHRAKRSTTG